MRKTDKCHFFIPEFIVNLYSLRLTNLKDLCHSINI